MVYATGLNPVVKDHVRPSNWAGWAHVRLLFSEFSDIPAGIRSVDVALSVRGDAFRQIRSTAVRVRTGIRNEGSDFPVLGAADANASFGA